MLKDITLGQYFPADSVVHSLDPRIKILLTLFFIIAIFFIKSLWGFAAVALYIVMVVLLSKLVIIIHLLVEFPLFHHILHEVHAFD